MPQEKTLFGWALFVFTACIKSVLDILYFRRDGTFDTVFHGRGTFSSHPVWCCVNITLDILAVLGAVTVLREATVSRRRRAGEPRPRMRASIDPRG